LLQIIAYFRRGLFCQLTAKARQAAHVERLHLSLHGFSEANHSSFRF
jgi:hypothetical protein